MTPKLYTTAEAAPVIMATGIFPSRTKPLTQRSVARLCKRGDLPGAYLVQGDWCIPDTAIDAYVEKTLGARKGRKPRKKKSE